MFARVISYPPLGQETVLEPVVEPDQPKVAFTVALEADDHFDWEVELWHNLSNASQWEGLLLQEPQTTPSEISVAAPSDRTTRYFKVTLCGRPTQIRPVAFTIRFRLQGEQGWKWVRDLSGTDDGQLLYQSSLPASPAKDDLASYFDHIGPELAIEHEASETPNVTLWTITVKAAPAHGESSGYSDHIFGRPKDYLRWFSLVRLWSPWLAPRQGRGYPFAEKDGVLYSFLRKDGLHVVVLAISGVEDVLTVFRHEAGNLTICSRNDREEEGISRVVVAVGQTFEEANAAAMYKARRIVSTFLSISESDKQSIDRIRQQSSDPKASWVQDWYDGFTYCTWNALGQNLTEGKILMALESLKQNGINITNLIIDDNWQSLDNEGQNQFKRGWTEFEANPKGFPNGMKAAISRIRQKYPGIQHIAVWHALLGYWGSISPTGKIARDYQTVEVKCRPGIANDKITVVDAPDVKRMYNDFYTFLLSTGIDSVKTDVQFMLDEIDTAPARRSLTSTYLSAWMSAQLRHFSAHAISCMSQAPSIIFPYLLPNITPAIPLRNSDDFFPGVEESHTWHIFTNAHAALLTQHLNVLPDWDMFQTDHKWAGFHAAARAISGGPIYITDEPGKHDVNLISQMTAQTCRGQTVILRPSVVGRSISQYISFEEERLLKVAAYDGAFRTGTAFVGLWNCRPEPRTEFVSLSDFRGTQRSDLPYILQSHRSGVVRLMWWLVDEDPDVLPLTLGGHEWELLSLRPVEGFFPANAPSIDSSSLNIANLGLRGKMTGPVAIVRHEVSMRSQHNSADAQQPFSPFSSQVVTGSWRLKCSVTLKALGTLGLWVSKELDLKKDLFILLEGKPIPFHCVEMTEHVLEVDVERAWKEMELESGYSNELEVELFVS